jgi:hypothetical protein
MAVQIAFRDCKHFYNEVQILARTSDMKECVTVDDEITDTCVQDDTYLVESYQNYMPK